MGGELGDGLRDRLRAVFDAALNPGAGTADAQLRYQDTPGWDSLGSVLLVSMIEDEFGVEVDVRQAMSMDSFGAALRLVRELLREPGGG